MVVRVAVFSADQGRLDDYRDFVDGHLFPTLRTVPGYVATFLGRDANSGQLISLSFWRREADAVAGEEAVGRVIRALPQGSAPRQSKVEKYVVEYRDLKEPLSK
jgi:heme-degrading monooxygenase HmoA